MILKLLFYVTQLELDHFLEIAHRATTDTNEEELAELGRELETGVEVSTAGAGGSDHGAHSRIRFDGALSNFGALNCLPDRQAVAAALADRIDNLVHRRKPFVVSEVYIGPDRRVVSRPEAGLPLIAARCSLIRT